MIDVVFARDYLRSLLTGLRRCAWDLLLIGVIYRALGVLFFGPLVGALLASLISGSGRQVLTDEDIVAFLSEPLGALGGLALAAIALTLLALEQACFMTALYADRTGSGMGAVNALHFALRRGWAVLRLAAHIVIRLVLTTLPFLGAGWAVYLVLLSEFDINYYLSSRPPEFVAAVLAGSLLLVGLAITLSIVGARIAVALPILLFEDAAPADALRASKHRSKGRWRRFATVLLAWGVASVLLGLLLGFPAWLIGELLVPRLADNINLLVATVGALSILLALSQFLSSLLSSVALSTAAIELYAPISGDTGPARERFAADSSRRQARLSSWHLATAAMAAAVGAVGLGLWLLSEAKVEDRTLVTAHRGASAVAPENTMAAVNRAIEDGAHWIEIDVQLSADGEVVVVHDQDLMRLGGQSAIVATTNLDDLVEIDVGSWFDDRFSGERIPTLQDVLEAARNRAGVTIELKYYGWDERLAPAVIDVIDRLDSAGNVVLMSLNPSAVSQVKALRPELPVGQLSAVAVGDLTRGEADFVAVQAANASSALLRTARERGKEVHVWTVNDAGAMNAMISLGVDNLITDRPDLALEVLAARAEMNPAERLLVGMGVFFLDEPAALNSPQEEALLQ